MELVVRVVCELCEERAARNGEDVEVVCEQLAKRYCIGVLEISDWQRGGWGCVGRGWDEVEWGVGHGCPVLGGDEFVDVAWEVLGVEC